MNGGVEPPPYIRADGPHSTSPIGIDRYRSSRSSSIAVMLRAGILASRRPGWWVRNYFGAGACGADIMVLGLDGRRLIGACR
jgi:hypothetical protein